MKLARDEAHLDLLLCLQFTQMLDPQLQVSLSRRQPILRRFGFRVHRNVVFPYNCFVIRVRVNVGYKYRPTASWSLAQARRRR